MRQVIIYPGEDGYWIAECPGLPACISQSRNREEALENIRGAITLYIGGLQEPDVPVAEDRGEVATV